MRNLTTTVSPHIHDGSSARRIMLDVIIALIPAFIAATIFFGPQVLVLSIVTISAAVVFELLFRLATKRDVSEMFDLSGVVTAMIMVLGIPANTPIWVSVMAVGVAIVVIKQLLGGIFKWKGVNPALVGHIVVTVLVVNAVHPAPMAWLSEYASVDAITTATPIQLLLDGQPRPSLWELFIGLHSGVMGGTSTLALLLGGAYLVWRRVISFIIPLASIGAAALVAVTLAGLDVAVPLLFSGSFVFVAIFMATDYATSPISLKGKIIFGIGFGLIVVLLRLVFGFTASLTAALLVMNLLVPVIDKFTLPKVFGHNRR